MEVVSLSNFDDESIGKTVSTLPTILGTLLSIRSESPYISAKQSKEDVAWIEVEASGRLVITPVSHSSLDRAHYGQEEAVYVNGLQLHRPIDLWPGSRLALQLAQVYFYIKPPKALVDQFPRAIEKAALAAYQSLLRREVLIVHQLNKQALRTMRADQKLARFDREADIQAKQAFALELKHSNFAKRAAAFKPQIDLLLVGLQKLRSRDDFEDPEEKESAITEIKAELKDLKATSNDIELLGLDVKGEAERARREEEKCRSEFRRMTAEKVELMNRVASLEKWLKLLAPHLQAAKSLLPVDATLPDKAAVLAEYFPPVEGAMEGDDGEDMDERPAVDSVFSDPFTLETQRWLAHLLALQALVKGDDSKKKKLETVRAVAAQELFLARPLAVSEVTQQAATVAAEEALVKAQANATVMPFAVKERVVVFEPATKEGGSDIGCGVGSYGVAGGVWLTARVAHCTPTQVHVVLEDTKREKVVDCDFVHNWLHHLRSHPHLFKAWKARAPMMPTDPRDRAPILGFLICPKEPKTRRQAWLKEMKPSFQALINTSPMVAKVFHDALHQRPWSHRHPIWKDPKFVVATPRLPTSVDHKSDWVAILAPRTFLPDPHLEANVTSTAAASDTATAATAKAKMSEMEAAALAEAEEAGDAFNEEEDLGEAAKKRRRAARRAARRAEAQQPSREQQEAAAEAKAAEPVINKGEITRTTAAARTTEATRELRYFQRHAGNEEALTELLRISSGGLSRHLLVHGAHGSGKQVATSLFVRKTIRAQIALAEGQVPDDGIDSNEERAAMNKWLASGTLVMELDHSALKSDNTLQAALSAFAKKPLYSPLDKRLNPPENGQGKKKKLTRFVVLKAFETVPPSLQMLLVHRFADVEDMGLRFIFVADDAKSVVAPLRANLLVVHLQCLPFNFWLQHLLTVCVAQRVGYDREGVELVASLSNGDLGGAIELVQQTFLKTSMVTKDNVMKAAQEMIQEREAYLSMPAPSGGRGGAAIAATTSTSAKVKKPKELRQPLEGSKVAHKPTVLRETESLGTSLRCTICTLPLPCKHVSGPGLVAVAKKRIQAMSQDDTMPLCPSYARTGCCEAMNTLGYCRNYHPPHLFTYKPATRRCPVCTTPEPCGICPWFLHRRSVAKAVANAAEELSELKRKGIRSTVTLARYRSLFDREIATCETLLDECAKWLNCSDRSAVANKMSDSDLVKGLYSTSEIEGKQKLDTVTRQWALSSQKLKLWLQGQSAKHLATAVAAGGDDAGDSGTRVRYKAVARMASSRYMPSATEVVADYNGYGEDEPAQELPRESPLLHINTTVLKMGLGKHAKMDSAMAQQGPSQDEIAAEARQKRKEQEEADAKAKANAARSKLSVFGSA